MFMEKGTFKHNHSPCILRGVGATSETSYIQSCVYAHGCYDVIIVGYDVIENVWKTLNV